MAVYYKFKCAKDYNSIPICGQFISVADLKRTIFESKLGKGRDYDIIVSDAQTDEEFVDDAAMIPKNSSVLIRRVPGPSAMPIVCEQEGSKVAEDKLECLSPSNGEMLEEEPEWDDFGDDLYAIPKFPPVQTANPAVGFDPKDKVDEDNKIKALVETPALDWNQQPQHSYSSGKSFGLGLSGRMTGGRRNGRYGVGSVKPPPGYVCHRCKIPGHFIQFCSTNGDPRFDIKKLKPPTGIPRSMLIASPDGSYSLQSGDHAAMKPDEAAFEKEIEGIPSSRPVFDLPPELLCPLCHEVMEDAVLTSKCCFSSFCDKCIREYIISRFMCKCGATNILADDLIPNKTLRQTINGLLVTTSSSSGNAGSMVQVQDTESALSALTLETPSPASLSAMPQLVSLSEETKPENIEKEPEEGVVLSEATTDSTGVIEQASQKSGTTDSTVVIEPVSHKSDSLLIPEDAEKKQTSKGKKRKKPTSPTSASSAALDMQWRAAFQGLGGAESFTGLLPLQPSACNPYWGGGFPMGAVADPFVGSFPGSMPFVGYAPPGHFHVAEAQSCLPPFGPRRALSKDQETKDRRTRGREAGSSTSNIFHPISTKPKRRDAPPAKEAPKWDHRSRSRCNSPRRIAKHDDRPKRKRSEMLDGVHDHRRRMNAREEGEWREEDEDEEERNFKRRPSYSSSSSLSRKKKLPETTTTRSSFCASGDHHRRSLVCN